MKAQLLIALALISLSTVATSLSAALVGTLPGKFSVDNKGAANYVIPLEVPPGINGMQPSLAFSYNSNSGNGIMGISFNLSAGQSTIMRGRRILARDGDSLGVRFTDKDRLYLDGKLLIRVGGSGSYFKSGSEYRTEVESFVKITAYGASNEEPDYFIVRSKDGTTRYYGNHGANSDAAFQILGNETQGKAYAYALSRVEDLSGNYMDYHYTAHVDGVGDLTGEYTLESIEYGGSVSSGKEHFAKIEFHYNLNTVVGDKDSNSIRDDARQGFVGSRTRASTQRLDRIVVKHENDLGLLVDIARYDCFYKYAPLSGLTRLNKIVAKLKSGVGSPYEALPPTSFEWTDYDEVRATPSSFGTLPTLWASDGEAPMNHSFADFNGDGKTDLVVTVTGSSGQNPGFDVYLSDGSQLTTATRWLNPGGPPIDSDYNRFFHYVGDFNGDGKQDVLWVNRQFDDIRMAYSKKNQDGFIYANNGNSIISDPSLFKDFNGTAITTTEYTKEHAGTGIGSRLVVADFDGDGRDDVLLHRFNGELLVALATNTGLATPTVWSSQAMEVGAASLDPFDLYAFIPSADVYGYFQVIPILGDYNGDGLVDYAHVFHDDGASNWAPGGTFVTNQVVNDYKTIIMLNTGAHGFGPMLSSDSMYMHNTTYAPEFSEIYYKVFPGDFDGDGITDLLSLKGHPTVGPYWRLQLKGTESVIVSPIPSEFTFGAETIPSYFRTTTEGYWNASIKGLGNWCMETDPAYSLHRYTYASVAGVGANNMTIGDFNYDGLSDLMWFVVSSDPNVKGWWICYSKGTNFENGGGFSVPVKLNGQFPDGTQVDFPHAEIDDFNTVTNLYSFQMTDLDGDGLKDWILREEGMHGIYSYSFSLSTGDRGDLIKAVSDGLASRTEIEYKSITEDAIYTSGAPVDYPIRESRSARFVVADVYKDVGGNFWTDSDSDGIRDWDESRKDAYHISYQYSGNRTDLSGRGNLGFHSFVTFDHQTNLFKYQFLTQSFPMTGMVKREQTYKALVSGAGELTGVQPISSLDSTVVFDEVRATPGGSLTGTVFPFMSYSAELRWEDGSATAYTVDFENPESLFESYNADYGSNQGASHSQIHTYIWFDEQSTPTPPRVLPTGYDRDLIPGAQDRVATGFGGASGWTNFLASNTELPGDISYGNITKTDVLYWDGYSTTTENHYFLPTTANGNLTGLLEWTRTSSYSPDLQEVNGPITRYTYNDQGLPATMRIDTTNTWVSGEDAKLDTKTYYDYSARGQLEKTELDGYNTAGHYFVGLNRIVSEVTAWDPTGRFPQTVKNAFGHATTTQYDVFGRPTDVTDVNGEHAITTYDGLGRVIKQRDDLRGLETVIDIELVAGGSGATAAQAVAVPSAVSGEGLALTSKYYKKEEATASPAVYTHYDRTGRVIRVIKEGFGGQLIHTDTIYNRDGEVVAVSNPYKAGTTSRWTITTYDALGRVKTVTAPTGTIATHTYKGRVTQVAVDAPDRDPQKTTTLANMKGETLKVWNADNVPSTLSEDGTGMTTPSLEFILDGFGRMRETRMWQGGTDYVSILAGYDALGNQTLLDDPDKGEWEYIYNALGNLTWQEDANGSTVASTYDQLGRVLTRTTMGAGTSAGYSETASWYYYDTANDAARHAVHDPDNGWVGAVQRTELSVTDSKWAPGTHNNTKAAYYYDRKGNQMIDLHLIDGKWFYRHQSYDDLNRPVRADYFWRPAGLENDYSQLPYAWQSYGVITEYDDNSYVTRVSDTLGQEWWKADPSVGYDHLDRPVLFRKGGPASYWTEQAYDPESELLIRTTTGMRAGATVGWDVQRNLYAYDGLGNLVSRQDIKRDQVVETFGYDELNRLTHRNGVLHAVYAENGNIESKRNAFGTLVNDYAYDPAKAHAVTTANGHGMDYDANGNIVSRSKGWEKWGFRWAGFDKPVWMLRRDGSDYDMGSAFLYGIDRQRVVHYEFANIDRSLEPDGQDNAAYWRPGTLNKKKIYVGGGLELDYEKVAGSWKMDTVRVYIPAPGGKAGAAELDPNAASAADHKFYVYHYDHLGSIQAITDWGESSDNYHWLASEDLAGREAVYSYDPWGDRRDAGDWEGSVYSQTPSPETFTYAGDDDITPRGFTGHEMLDDLGLVHMNGRIYDPLLGRFLSADPLVQAPGNLQSYNRYTYVMNNPLTLYDPSGYAWWNPFSWFGGDHTDTLNDSSVSAAPIELDPFPVTADGETPALSTVIGSTVDADGNAVYELSPLSVTASAGPHGMPGWGLGEYQQLFRDIGWNNYHFYDEATQLYYGKTATDLIRFQLITGQDMSGAWALIQGEAPGFVMSDEDRLSYAMAMGAVGLALKTGGSPVKPGRNGALRQAKRDAGIPMNQQPLQVRRAPLTDRNGNPVLRNGRPVMTREYVFQRSDGSRVVIQEHSAGHRFGAPGGRGDQGSHFNVRPIENTRNGRVPGTQPHYPFE